MKNKNLRPLIGWLVIFIILLVFSQSLRRQFAEPEIDYSTFRNYLKDGKLVSVTIRPDLIRGEYIEEGKNLHFKTAPLDDPKLLEDLDKYKVKQYRGEASGRWWTVFLINFGPVILLVLLWFFMIRQMQGGGKQVLSFGRSRAKLYSEKKTKATFQDVAGCDEVKEELQEIIEFLKEPAKFQKLGGKIPKGVLLYGAPGTGKTLLARAVAGGDTAVPSGPATPSFSDVPDDHWAYKHVEYCVDVGIATGYPGNTYRPDEVVSRGQMAVYVARAIATPTGDAGVPDYTGTPTFTDVTSDNEWAWCLKYVEYCVGQGIVQGYGDEYRPANAVTRDQMAVYIQRAFALPMPE